MTQPLISPRKKNLVILRAGDESLHPQWLADGARDFDLFVSYYGNTPQQHQDTADFYEMRKGPKWSCIAELMQEQPQLIEQYEAFWFPDDDLATTTHNINRMFAFFHAFELTLAQPALTQDSYYSWKHLLQRSDYIIRDTCFVEIMAPIFDREVLRLCMPSFGESRSGWGLDCLWPTLLKPEQQKRMGIIDATPIKHTRPVGGNLYTNNPDLDSRRDEQRILENYALQDNRMLAKYQPLSGVQYQQPSLKDKLLRTFRVLNRKRLARRHAKKY